MTTLISYPETKAKKMISRKFFSVTTAAALLTFSSTSMATYPTFDGANLIEAVTLNVESISARVEKAIQEKIKRELEKVTAINQEESENAKEMSRIKAEQDLETASKNFDLARAFKPVDVCKTIAEQRVAERVKIQVLSRYGAVDSDDDCMPTEKDPQNQKISREVAATYEEPSKQSEKRAKKVDTLIELCSVEGMLKEDDSSDGSDEGIASVSDLVRKSWCFDASLMGQTNISAYDKSQYLAARNQVDVLVDPVPKQKASSTFNLSTQSGKEAILKSLRKDMLLNVSKRVLHDYVDMKSPINYFGDNVEDSVYLSEMQRLEQFVLGRYLDPDWIRKVSNTHPDKNTEAGKELSYSPEQVTRESAIIDGFLAHMAVLQYKSMLKQEMLQALIISTQVNEL